MRIPAEATDPDIVLYDSRERIASLEARLKEAEEKVAEYEKWEGYTQKVEADLTESEHSRQALEAALKVAEMYLAAHMPEALAEIQRIVDPGKR